MTIHAEILSRLREATGPSRLLDILIHRAGGLSLISDEQIASIGKPGYGWTPHKNDWPEYTASLDAITALIEHILPGWIWDAASTGHVWIALGDLDYAAVAATPALALCIALFEALAAKEDGR